ncbi:4-hydroxy-tetrahydrodipicolinate reductase [Microvirga flavescens]|uniref:4-hydroxy-tetrahydrodipicolinate reductase n=1 Tax=Microvirga flavescens TaxID=2249811 RepID=UPI000DDBAB97|nr:4-hydroxy-tetrahydrodipicolinate reductase [Microvirga flavescens]
MRLAVVGAGGRMGRMLIKAIAETEGCRLVGAIAREGSAHLGHDAGILAGIGLLEVNVTDDPLPVFAQADGILDFTAPAATRTYAALAAQARIVHVIGTTGLQDEDFEKLEAAARHARIVQSGNMSLGVNLLAGLVRKVAATLGDDFDIEILEMHHRMKVDAPSGTALLLGEAAAQGRNVSLKEHSVRMRDGHTGARKAGDIGFATLRGGTVVGDHTVMFAGAGERLELSHRAEDRSIFARGAVRAALWAFDKKPGYYSMADVLGLE